MKTENKKEKEQGSKKIISPKVKSRSFFLWLDRKNAHGTWGPILLALVLMVFIWGLVSLVYYCKGSTNPVKKAFVDMVSPVTARNLVYESSSKLIPEGDCSGGKLVSVENERINVWYLFTFYVLGLVFFSGLFVATITNSLRTRADRFKQGMFKLHRISGHIVILGFNDMVPGLIKHILDDESESSRKVLVGVKGRADEKYNQICDQADLNDDECWRVVVFHVDNIYEEHLKKRLRVHLAKDVYIIGEGDDAYSLNAYEAICKIQQNRRIYKIICKIFKKENSKSWIRRIYDTICNIYHFRWIPECYVQMQYQSTFALFQTYSKESMESFNAFNFHDEWARKMIMLEQIDTRNGQSITADSDKHIHLVIIGMTEMGEALAREAAFLCHYPNFKYNNKRQHKHHFKYKNEGQDKHRTKITFIDPEAKKNMTYVTGKYHHLFDLCHYSFQEGIDNNEDGFNHTPNSDFLDVEFEFIQANIADAGIHDKISEWAVDKSQVLTIAACSDKPHRSMAAGLYLPDAVFDNNIPVWVYQPAKGDMGEYLDGSRFRNVTTFGMSGKELDIKNGEIVSQAKRLNHFFNHLSDDTVDYTDEEAVEMEWNNCKVFEKWSSIYNVSAIPAKLRSVGWKKGNDDAFIDANLEVLAEMEHNRWNVEKLLMGFRPTTNKEYNQNVQCFIHDDIRPYNDLNEATKEKVKKLIKEIPNIISK